MKKGEIWILEIPFVGGKEQKGRRPAVIVAESNINLVTVIPLTSNLSALRFNNTLKIDKSEKNGLEKDSIALIFHIQSLDKRRFIKKIGLLEKIYIDGLDKILKDYFNF